ncbi:MAG: peptide-methionine (S)-S-oxide reductase MsrA [Rhodospirillaceae bacterium]|nr:peptide-methionine (S)-S-oxide reductase MsrA [Rhodospirillaceae bacterium]
MFKPRISAPLILSLLFSAALLAGPARADTAEKGLETAIFAGGCFWCVESDFDKVPGVVKTISGFSGGVTPNPTYKQVVTESTGHREVVQITFDPKKVTYAHLVDVLFHSVDPTDGGGQFCDRGHSYSTAIYATTPEQKKTAEAVKKKLQDSGVLKKPIVTPIEDAGPFFPAEEYHQDFYTKSPVRYKFYRFNCGRNARVQALWGENAHKGIAKH